MDCSVCIFAVTNDGPPMSGGPFPDAQAGCEAGRLELLIELGKAEIPFGSNFYKLSRFCTMHRQQPWAEAQECESLVEKAKEEVKCRFGIVIEYKEGESQTETTNSILDIDYPPELVKIVMIASESQIKTSNMFFIDHIHKFQNNLNKAMFTMDKTDDISMKDRAGFFPLMGGDCSHLLKITQGQTIDKDYFNFINSSVNDKLEMITFFEDKKNGVKVIPRTIVDSLYLDFNNYDLMCEHLKDLSIQQNKYMGYEENKQIHNNSNQVKD